jgi:hypothetical protein
MTEVAWQNDLEASCRRARDEGKLVLLDFFSPQ